MDDVSLGIGKRFYSPAFFQFVMHLFFLEESICTGKGGGGGQGVT
jgi:hypothetical protein